MRYQQDLQVQLRERYRRLVTTTYFNAVHESALVVSWIEHQAPLRALIAEAEQVEADLDFDTFRQAIFQRRDLSWTSTTEAGRASLAWKLMRDIANSGPGDLTLRAYVLSTGGGTNVTDRWRQLVEHGLQPFFDYLTEQLSAGDSVLHVLERYVRSVEWFDREDLYAKYQQDTANGEEVYNLDLQRHLFNDGNFITHAKARSASGEPDLIGGLDTDDPLVCDGKLFAPGRSKAYIAKGFHQVIKYAQDYAKNVAYLVVFNLTERLLEFPTDGKPGVWPPYVESSGVRVYFVGIRALPPQSTASKAGRASVATISREDLFNPDLE